MAENAAKRVAVDPAERAGEPRCGKRGGELVRIGAKWLVENQSQRGPRSQIGL